MLHIVRVRIRVSILRNVQSCCFFDFMCEKLYLILHIGKVHMYKFDVTNTNDLHSFIFYPARDCVFICYEVQVMERCGYVAVKYTGLIYHRPYHYPVVYNYR